MKSSLLKKLVIGTFLSVPAVSSLISTIHLIDLFNMGNPTWLSIFLAVTFELGSIASLLAISVLEKIKVGAIWFIFFILSALQIIGNVYYSYNFTSNELLSNPLFLQNFMDLFSPIIGEEIRDAKIFLSCIIGIPIPLIALFFLKSNIDYLKPSSRSITETSSDDSDHTIKEQVEDEEIQQSSDQTMVLDELTSEAESLGLYETQSENPEQTAPEGSLESVAQELDTPKKNYKVKMIGNNIIKY